MCTKQNTVLIEIPKKCWLNNFYKLVFLIKPSGYKEMKLLVCFSAAVINASTKSNLSDLVVWMRCHPLSLVFEYLVLSLYCLRRLGRFGLCHSKDFYDAKEKCYLLACSAFFFKVRRAISQGRHYKLWTGPSHTNIQAKKCTTDLS